MPLYRDVRSGNLAIFLPTPSSHSLHPPGEMHDHVGLFELHVELAGILWSRPQTLDLNVRGLRPAFCIVLCGFFRQETFLKN